MVGRLREFWTIGEFLVRVLENGAVDASVLTQSYSLKDAEQGFIDSENLEVTKVLLDCSQT